ncbi:MAG: dihydroneopterin aldolase family protein [Halobacteriota archaeon]|nr:dihydroneopterin aldolase family protein [Halobacteriota archaeon]
MISDREKALFESGIKLGALYHQFVGSPVGPETVKSLKEAIEKSISLQPHVKSIRVKIDEEVVAERINSFGYCELEGRMLDVEVIVAIGSVEAHAKLSYDKTLDYPMMSVKQVIEGP